MAWQVEVTDTFGGDANYCWVRRYTIERMPEHIALSTAARQRNWLVRTAKRLAGYNGVRGRVTADYGDNIEWKPYRVLHVMFITWIEDEPPTLRNVSEA